MIESVGEFEEEHNHQEKYFQFYKNKRWLTAQTVPLCVELPKDFHFLLNANSLAIISFLFILFSGFLQNEADFVQNMAEK